jgi:hypothetical protein
MHDAQTYLKQGKKIIVGGGGVAEGCAPCMGVGGHKVYYYIVITTSNP